MEFIDFDNMLLKFGENVLLYSVIGTSLTQSSVQQTFFPTKSKCFILIVEIQEIISPKFNLANLNILPTFAE